MYKASELDEVVGDLVSSREGAHSPSGSTGSNETMSKVAAPNNQVNFLFQNLSNWLKFFANKKNDTCLL